jgi:hypothetical protein
VLEEGYDEQAARLETVETGKPYRLEDANSSAGLTGSNHPAPPDSSPPAGGLVELVTDAIHDEAGSCCAEVEARAAILACADYLEDRADHTGARWLREEVGQ